jgi:hypothetical protein
VLTPADEIKLKDAAAGAADAAKESMTSYDPTAADQAPMPSTR